MDITENRSKQDEWMSIVQRQVKSIRYGVVQIVVHDSHVVQIERTEKVRLQGEHPQRKGGE